MYDGPAVAGRGGGGGGGGCKTTNTTFFPPDSLVACVNNLRLKVAKTPP